MTSRPGLRSFSPIFPVADLAAALAHYEALGFRTRAYSDDYGFADRAEVQLHLTLRSTSRYAADGIAVAYLFVRDADALFAEWSAAGVGTTEAPAPMPWRMHEGTHTDADGNVLRFGSALD